MKKILINKSGGALLFAIITAFVISFVGASLTILSTNQYRMIENEIKRKEAMYWIRAGIEYANYMIRTEQWPSFPVQNIPLPDNDKIKITVDKYVPGSLSDYNIKVTTTY